MNRNCTACNIMIDINNYKKDRTVCKNCYDKIKRKNNNNTLPPNKIDENVDNNDSKYENGANVIIGPRNIGNT